MSVTRLLARARRGRHQDKMSNQTVAERLVEARGNRRREDVAKEVGVSLSAIAMYECGKRIPRDEIKVRLANCYQTSVQALFF